MFSEQRKGKNKQMFVVNKLFFNIISKYLSRISRNNLSFREGSDYLSEI